MTQQLIQNLIIQSKNGVIHGQLYQNMKGSNSPLIIFLHGLGDSMVSGRDYANYFALNGYSVFIFDFISGSIMTDMTKMSVFTEQDDLNSVVNYFRKNDAIKRAIYLLGASQGGVVSSLVATTRNDIQGLVLLYPAFVMKDEMNRLFANRHVPDTFHFAGMTLGKIYVEKLITYDLMGNATGYSGRTLIFHGTVDSVVPIRYSEAAANRFSNAKLIKVANAGYGFYGSTQTKVAHEIKTFLNEQVDMF